MRSAVYTHNHSQEPRPLGVWVLTVCAAVFAGILPLLGSLAYMLIPDLGGNMLLMLVTAGLSIAVLGAAVGAWQGNDTARLALVGLASLFYLLLAITNFYTATSDFVVEDVQRKALMTGIRSLLWIPLYVWYFLRAKTVRWYRPW